jgi:uncharacterized protein (UPF0276 family)
VAALFEYTLTRTGPLPVLIEWDNNVPGLDILLDEASKVDRLLSATGRAVLRRAS